MNSSTFLPSFIKPLNSLSLFYLIPPHLSTFEKLEQVPDYVQDVFPYFVLLIFIEIIIRWLKHLPPIRVNDTIGSIGSGLIMQTTSFVFFKGLETVLYIWIYGNMRLYELPWDSVITWCIALLVYDCCFYWFHRMAHELNLFWAAHQVHHSSQEYNLTTALRQSVFQRFTSFFFYLPMAFFVPPTHYIVHRQFNLVYQFWIHTECIGSLGPLEYILNTPSHHRVHHGRNRYCIDKNYAGVLIIWDRMFGTFEAEREGKTIYYGLVHNVKSFNPIWIQIQHFVYLIKRLWSTASMSEGINILLKGPGWSPGKPRLGLPEDVPEVPEDITVCNPHVPLWIDIYSFIHFALVVVMGFVLSTKKMETPHFVAIAVVLYITYSLTCIGMMHDHNPFAPFCEIIRLLIVIGMDYYYGFLFSDVLMIQGVRVLWIMSTFIWCLVFFKQMKTKLD